MENIFHLLSRGQSRKKETSGNDSGLGPSNLSQPTDSSERTGIVPLPPLPIAVVPASNEAQQRKSVDKALMLRSPKTANVNVSNLNANDDDLESSAENALDKLRNSLPRVFKKKVAIENGLNKAAKTVAVGNAFVSGLMSSGVIQEGLNHFLSGDSQIMNFLDDVSRIHPIAAVVVVAFKTAWKFVKTRQENDKRIMALYVGMSDMVAVLHRLRDVPRKKTETDNIEVKRSLGVTLEGVSRSAVKYIEECGNMCEIYSKTRTVVKVLNCNYWNTEFTKYLQIFGQHREKFEFALTLHITGRVEDIAGLQKEHLKKLSQIEEKLSNVSNLLEKLASPAEKDIILFVKEKGGIDQVVQKIKSNDSQSDVLLRELNEYEREKSHSPSHGGLQAGHGPGKLKSQQDAIEDLRKAIQADQNQIIQKNLESFQRKFEIQQKQFQKELEHVVEKVGENIIRTLTAGLHTRILDQDVGEIWKIMKWGGSVKARYFVMALHDYFTEKWGLDEPDSLKDGLPFSKLRGKSWAAKRADAWALSYLNPANAQTLSEAFDEDASGFITIREVNEFISSKPDGWSLLHWIAYWIIGWHHSLACYRDKIQVLIVKLLQCLPSVRRENRSAADEYMETMLCCILPIILSLKPIEYDEVMGVKFNDYDKREEQRLKNILAEVHYTIDGKDGVKLVTGTGQIEKELFPLLYLLLERHLEIFRVAERKVLHPSDLEEAEESIRIITDAVSDRVWRLEAIFTQQKLRANEHFQRFANGIFEYTHDPSKFWSTETLLRIDLSRPYSYFSSFNDKEDDVKEPDIGACNYPPSEAPLWTLEDAFRKAYSDKDEPSESVPKYNNEGAHDTDGVDTSHTIEPVTMGVGDIATQDWISKLSCQEWNGFFHSDKSDYQGQLLSFTFNVDNNKAQTDGRQDITLEGSILTQSHEYPICAVISTDEGITLEPAGDKDFRLHGSISSNEQRVITGEMTIEVSSEMRRCTFLLEQRLHDAAFYVQYRPPPSEFHYSRSKALWKFAAAAIMGQISAGNTFCRAFWDERKRARERFVGILLERKLGKALEEGERDVYHSLRENLRREDQEYYEALVQHKLSSMTKHGGYTCDSCGRTIYGARTSCLTCAENNGYNTVDFCDRHDCVTAQETPGRVLTTPHLPSHTLIKTRRVVFQTLLGRIIKDAKTTQDTIKRFLDYTYSKPSIGMKKQQSIDGLICVFCRDKVSTPFWACIEGQCNELTCVCIKCDQAGKAAIPEGYSAQHNFDEHVLVKWQATSLLAVTVPTVEERLARMESKMAELDASLARKVDRLLAALSTSMGNGLQDQDTFTWSSI